ncbi:hypothetical protein V6615_05760 [Oscillospiraceae bacterium PP1C4]
MQVIFEGKGYQFFSDGFQTEQTQEMIQYDKIISIKRDVSAGSYEIVYANEKGKKCKLQIDISEQHTEALEKILKEKIWGLEVTVRQRTVLEAANTWIWLLASVIFLSLLTVYLGYSGDSVRLPIVLIPIIKLGLNLGLDKIILINVGTLIACTVGVVFSYSRKKQIVIYKTRDRM